MLAALLVALGVGAIEVSVDDASQACASAQIVRDEVRARLGREPGPQASATVVITRAGQRFNATLAPGVGASRSFSSNDCHELVASVALAIAIALDPSLLFEAPSTQRADPQPAPPPAPLAIPQAAPAQPPPNPVHFGLAPVAGVSAGAAAPVAPTFGVAASLSTGPWWFGLEGRLDAPTGLGTAAARITTSSLLGTFSLGWQHRWVRASLPLSAGALFVTGTGSAPVRDSRPLLLAGVEVCVRVPLASWFTLEPFVRAQLVATRVTVLAGAETAWVTWPVAVVGGLAARFELGAESPAAPH